MSMELDFIGMNDTVVVIRIVIDIVVVVENTIQIDGSMIDRKIDDIAEEEICLIGIDGVVLIGNKLSMVKKSHY